MSRTRVYVGRLSPRVRQDDLLEVFEYYGRVLSCDIKNGFAFIEYDDPRDAEDAVYEEHNRDLQGTRMIVEFAKGGGGGRGPPRGGPPGGPRFGPPQRSDHRVVVSGLPRDMSWQDMKDVFRKYCDVLFTDVYIDRDGKSRGVAEFRSKDDVRRAIKYVDDTEVRGSRIYVDDDSSRRSRSPSPRRRSRSRSRSPSPRRRSRSPSPRRGSRSPSPRRASRSPSPPRGSRSPSPRRSRSASRSPARSASRSPAPKRSASRSPSAERDAKRRRESSSPSPARD